MRLLPSVLWIGWAVFWAFTHVRARRNAAYRTDRRFVGSRARYKAISFIAFGLQNLVCLASFWTESSWLLSFDIGLGLRVVGGLVLLGSTFLYWSALRHLGDNYSPCFDSYAPKSIVTSGPYRFLRHPMYLAKVGVALGSVLVSRSWWLIPVLVWVSVEALLSAKREMADVRQA